MRLFLLADGDLSDNSADEVKCISVGRMVYCSSRLESPHMIHLPPPLNSNVVPLAALLVLLLDLLDVRLEVARVLPIGIA